MFRLWSALLISGMVLPQLRAEDRIRSFHSELAVQRSGDLVVTETIEVWVEGGDKIKRGILRDIPLRRETPSGGWETVDLKVLSVKRGGKGEHYVREPSEGELRLKIGKEGKLLGKQAIHTYEITYIVREPLYLEKEREVLYWNVNGTEWEFPADKVSATIRLPEGIEGTKIWGYTGKLGEQGEDYRGELMAAGASIEATRKFNARENLSLVLEWPPGLLGPQAYEEERVLSAHSAIKVENSGGVLVTERIEVRLEGGLMRALPRRYDIRWGLKRKRSLEVLGLTLNGEKVPHEIRGNVLKAERAVKWGVHTYEIHYRMGRSLGPREGRDVLRWKLTRDYRWRGPVWAGSLPVDELSATVSLPENIEGTLGPVPAGTRAKMTSEGAEVSVLDSSSPAFEVRWPPGLLDAAAYKEDSFLKAHPWMVFGIVILVGALIYYLIAWVAVGRDPKKGVIIPQFAPPVGYSPGAVRYLDRMKYDETCMAAGVLGLAAKGVVTIKESGGSYTVRARSQAPPLPSGGPPPLPPTLTPEERILKDALVGRGELTLEDENWKEIRHARLSHEGSISRKLKKTHFLRNMGWWFPGAIITVFGFLVLCFSAGAWRTALIVGPLFLVSTWWVSLSFSKLVTSWRARRVWAVIFHGAISLPLFFIWAAFVAFIVFGSGPWAGTGVVYAALLNLIFYHLIKAPTPLGRKILDHVEGFRHYLSVAEEERLNLENPPEKTPELFEQFLPYALALGCEQQWSQKFDSVLRVAGQSPGRSDWSPSYYTGSVSGLGSSFASSIGSSLSSSLAASSSAPSSSGGGFSGGFSGGGGGGGGGSGW